MASISSTKMEESGGSGLVITSSEDISADPDDQELISEIVPAGKKWKIQYSEICFRHNGRWKITLDDVIIGGGINGPSQIHDRTDLPDFFYATSGQTVKVLYLYVSGPNNVPIDAFLGIVQS